MKLLHVCEVCGKREVLTPEEAFDQGWDYPPRMGAFGIVSPRTCGDCRMTDTVWWKLIYGKINPNDLCEKDKETLKRIIGEPQSILCDDMLR